MSGNRELVERFIASLEARDWDDWAALLHPAVVYEIPQSRERIRGRDRYLRLNQVLELAIAAKPLDNLVWTLRCDSDHGPHRVRQCDARHI